MDTRRLSRRTDGATEALLTALEQAVGELSAVTRTRKEKVKTDSGEILTETVERIAGETGMIDRRGLQQLTAVLRDLREITGEQPELSKREQTLRLQRLERELDEQGRQLEIRMEEPLDAFAE